MMNIFEGNQNLLNIYAAADKPSKFFALVSGLFIGVSIFLGVGVGLLGYLAFGSTC
jgi:hypothetical protein